MKFLKKTNDEIGKSGPDMYDHFGSLIACQLRQKPSSEADAYMKIISNVIFSELDCVLDYAC